MKKFINIVLIFLFINIGCTSIPVNNEIIKIENYIDTGFLFASNTHEKFCNKQKSLANEMGDKNYKCNHEKIEQMFGKIFRLDHENAKIHIELSERIFMRLKKKKLNSSQTKKINDLTHKLGLLKIKVEEQKMALFGSDSN